MAVMSRSLHKKAQHNSGWGRAGGAWANRTCRTSRRLPLQHASTKCPPASRAALWARAGARRRLPNAPATPQLLAGSPQLLLALVLDQVKLVEASVGCRGGEKARVGGRRESAQRRRPERRTVERGGSGAVVGPPAQASGQALHKAGPGRAGQQGVAGVWASGYCMHAWPQRRRASSPGSAWRWRLWGISPEGSRSDGP